MCVAIFNFTSARMKILISIDKVQYKIIYSYSISYPRVAAKKKKFVIMQLQHKIFISIRIQRKNCNLFSVFFYHQHRRASFYDSRQFTVCDLHDFPFLLQSRLRNVCGRIKIDVKWKRVQGSWPCKFLFRFSFVYFNAIVDKFIFIGDAHMLLHCTRVLCVKDDRQTILMTWELCKLTTCKFDMWKIWGVL